MPVEVELVHAEAGRCVVLARQRDSEGITAMALGEAASAEDAEDRARARLQALQQQAPAAIPRQPGGAAARTAPTAKTSSSPAARPEPPAANPAAASPVASPQARVESQLELQSEPEPEPEAGPEAGPEAVAEPAADPEDWSSELANLDLQLKRLGWSRDQEATYLLRAFGHGSRSRLTTYGDLLAYLRALEDFGPGADPASCAIPLKRSDLLSQCDQLLSQLGWSAAQGRQLLESTFQRSSRQQLSDPQLLEFNMLLEGELMDRPAAG